MFIYFMLGINKWIWILIGFMMKWFYCWFVIKVEFEVGLYIFFRVWDEDFYGWKREREYDFWFVFFCFVVKMMLFNNEE